MKKELLFGIFVQEFLRHLSFNIKKNCFASVKCIDIIYLELDNICPLTFKNFISQYMYSYLNDINRNVLLWLLVSAHLGGKCFTNHNDVIRIIKGPQVNKT